jgi:hypothetical protein
MMMCPPYPTPTNFSCNEQDKKEKEVTRSEIKLFSPTKETLQPWRHRNIALWSALQDTTWTPIPSNQYLLPVAHLVPYTKMLSQCGPGLQELILQNFQHKEIFCLLHLTVLQCLDDTEGNNDLDPSPIRDHDSFDSGDPENSATGTMCYDLVSSQLVPSDHLISAFQQGHQEFPLVKLKDDTYHSFLPMVPIQLGHTFAQYTDLSLHTTLLDQLWAIRTSCKHLVINMGSYNFYDESPNEYSFYE